MNATKKLDSRRLEQGYFFEPTILGGVKPEMGVAQEEIFGPVVALIEVRSFETTVKIGRFSR